MTLEQVINVIRTFREAHLQLKSHHIGRISEDNLKKDDLYYRMLVEPTPSSIDQGNETFEFRIGVFGRVNNDNSNRESVLSDTRQICTDFISYFKNNPAQTALTIKLPIVINDYFEQGGDVTAGYFFDAVLSQYQGLNYCSLPIGTTPPVSNGAYIRDKATGTIIYTLYPNQYYDVEILRAIIDTIDGNSSGTIIDPIT